MAIVVEPDRVTAESLRSAVGTTADLLTSLDALPGYLEEHEHVDVVLIGPSVDGDRALRIADGLRVTRPALGVVLIRRRIDATLLTDALRAGVRDVVDDRDMTRVMQSVRRQQEISAQILEGGASGGVAAPKGRVVTVFSAKGGCGKTTVATNLAAVLAHAGASVGIVDLDLSFGDVAIALQLFPTRTLIDAVPMEGGLDVDGIESLLTSHESGLRALTAPVTPDGRSQISASLVDNVLRLMARKFETVIVDTAPDLDDEVLVAFDHSDLLILLLTPDIPALKNLKLTVDTLRALSFPLDRVRVVVNRADADVGLPLKDIERTLKLPIAATIPSSRDVPATTNRGELITIDDPQHPVSQAIAAFARKELLRDAAAAAQDGTTRPPSATTPIASAGGRRRSERRGLFGRRG